MQEIVDAILADHYDAIGGLAGLPQQRQTTRVADPIVRHDRMPERTPSVAQVSRCGRREIPLDWDYLKGRFGFRSQSIFPSSAKLSFEMKRPQRGFRE